MEETGVAGEKPLTCGKWLAHILCSIKLYGVHLVTTWVTIDTYCTGRCKSNYRTITITTKTALILTERENFISIYILYFENTNVELICFTFLQNQYSLTTDTFLYLGKDGDNFYKGYIDEVGNIILNLYFMC